MLLGTNSAGRIMGKSLGTFSLECHNFVAIVRPEAIGSMVAVTRGSSVTFLFKACT